MLLAAFLTLIVLAIAGACFLLGYGKGHDAAAARYQKIIANSYEYASKSVPSTTAEQFDEPRTYEAQALLDSTRGGKHGTDYSRGMRYDESEQKYVGLPNAQAAKLPLVTDPNDR